MTRRIANLLGFRDSSNRKAKRRRHLPLVLEVLENRIMPIGGPGTFAIIGDYGSAEGSDNSVTPDAGDFASEQSVANMVQSWNPDFITTTGDNNYFYGAASTIDGNVGQFYHNYIYPYNGAYGAGSPTGTNRFWPAPGDHDWGDGNISPASLQPYLSYFSMLPGNGRYYDVTLEGGLVELFILDSVPTEPDGTTATSVQGQWLEQQLAQSTATWKLVIDAFAPYSSGPHGSYTNMQWPFQAWGATAVISGHDHDYERLIEGNNFPYFVNGLGGQEEYEFQTPIAGSQVRYNETNGAMLVTVNGSTSITFQF